jgi:hypothetical protein
MLLCLIMLPQNQHNLASIHEEALLWGLVGAVALRSVWQ